jgi:hypothetical protein
MKRSVIAALAEPRWTRLFDELDLEVQLVPAGMPDFTSGKLLGVSSEHLDRQVCSKAFVDFRNYQDDDGTPIDNSMETRLELYQTPILRRGINNALEAMNGEIAMGESGADSA